MSNKMILGLASAGLLCMSMAVAHAAPVGNAGGPYLARETGSAVQKVARVCWWEDGWRRCGWLSRRGLVSRYGYGYYYGAPRPEELRTGSDAWWRAMDREGRGGFGRR